MANGFNIGPNVVLQGNPALDAYRRKKATEQEQAAAQQKAQAEAQQKKNQFISDVMTYRPGEYWQRYGQMVNDFTQQHVRDWVVDQMNQGVDYNSPEFQRQLSYRKSQAENLAKQTGYIKENWGAMDTWLKEQGDYLNRDYYNKAMNSYLYDGKDNQQNPLYFDERQFRGLQDDLEGVQWTNVARDFVDELPTTIEEFYTAKNNELGEDYFDITKIKRNALLQWNSAQRKYVVNVNDDVLGMARGNEWLRKGIEKEEAEGRDPKAWLQETLNKYSKPPQEISHRPGRKITGTDEKTSDRQVAAMGKVDWLYDAVDNFNEAAAQDAVGGYAGFGYVDNIEYLSKTKEDPGLAGNDKVRYIPDRDNEPPVVEVDYYYKNAKDEWELRKKVFDLGDSKDKEEYTRAISRARDDAGESKHSIPNTEVMPALEQKRKGEQPTFSEMNEAYREQQEKERPNVGTRERPPNLQTVEGRKTMIKNIFGTSNEK